MTQNQVLKAFKDTGALLEGHFELRSKLHSNRYFQWSLDLSSRASPRSSAAR